METFFDAFVIVFALILMTISLFGLVVPIFPGTVIIWVIALIYGLIAGFGTSGWVIFGVLTVLMVVGALADNVMMGKKARDEGASWKSIAAALMAALVATVVFTPIGGLAAAPLVLYIFEKRRVQDHDRALATVKALAIGWGWAFVIRFGIGMIMIGLWGVWVLYNVS